MAKTYNNLFPSIYDFESLHAAYLRARKGKREHSDVLIFSLNLESNLIELQNELIWGSYQTGNYKKFYVYEPKQRLVAALPFRDRVIQHSIVAAIEPIWERRFIFDSYACRPGKGTHAGANRAQEYLRSVKRQYGRIYALKADISKYFPSIDHAVIKQLLSKRIACKRTLELMFGIIDSWEDSPGRGLPIGNLTSQLMANIYLHELDEFVKCTLRERYYIRYMDDFIIVHHDKAYLHRQRAIIEDYLSDSLRLKTNRKTQVFPVGMRRGRALDFLGYRIWPTHRRLRVGSVRRMRTKLRAFVAAMKRGVFDSALAQATIRSWVAHTMHADAYRIRMKLLSLRWMQQG